MTTTPAMQAIAAAARQHLTDTAETDRQLIGDDAGPHWETVEEATNRLAFIDAAEAAAIRLLEAQNHARGREIERLRAELEQARQQTEAAHCRLHHIAARLEHLDVRDDPTGVAGDVGPYLDGPLHPQDLADYRAAQLATAEPGCGCQSYVHPGHYPSCPERTTQPTA